MRWMVICSCAALLALCGCGGSKGSGSSGASSGGGNSAPKLATKEATTFKKDPQILAETLLASADGKHIAYQAQRGSQRVAVLDQLTGAAYDKIFNLAIAPDGAKLAYGALKGNKCFLVADVIEHPCEDLAVGSPLFSADGKHLAAVLKKIINKKEQWVLQHDSDESKPFDFYAKGTLLFSPDGKRLACGIVRDGKFRLLLNGVEGKEYDLIGGTAFSPDSKRVAYVAVSRTQALSGDVNRFFVVIDGNEQPAYDAVEADSIRFSPDSKRVAYKARKDGKLLYVVDGREGKPYSQIGTVSPFSPDSAHVAYIAQVEKGSALVLDNAEGVPCEGIGCKGSPYGPDGRLALVAVRGGKYQVIIGTTPGAEYDKVDPASLSIGGNRHAYAAKRGGNWLVVTDTSESQPYEEIYTVAVSPKGQVAWLAKKGTGYHLVVDDAESAAYEGLVRGAKIHFDDSGRASTLLIKRAEIVRVEAGQ